MEKPESYIITGGEEGKKRLNVLSEVLYSYTKTLLLQQGLAKGMSFLDVGCGGGNVSVMAAGMVGDAGRVTAIDFDEEIIALNKEEVAAAGISTIAYETLSAYDLSSRDEYDITYARFLLSHLTDPLRVLKNMAASLKPGGRVIVEDIHFDGHFCYPACTAFNEYVALFTATASQREQNANIGPELLRLFGEAGLQDVGFDVIQPTFNTGSGKWMGYITMDKIKEAVIAQGLADATTIDNILKELETFTNDDTTIMSLPRIFRFWGTKK
ncbi:MAG: ubiE 5 [Flavipsychrobacter sp.]|nr:ubiE 5 [Flavipsychrobacter sp.]